MFCTYNSTVKLPLDTTRKNKLQLIIFLFIIYLFRERELLTNYFSIMASLEYNNHQHALQQHLLNELVDTSISVSLNMFFFAKEESFRFRLRRIYILLVVG